MNYRQQSLYSPQLPQQHCFPNVQNVPGPTYAVTAMKQKLQYVPNKCQGLLLY